MLNQVELCPLDLLDLPPLAELEDLDDRVLRFFDTDEHLPGAECPCLPRLERYSSSLTGYSFVHNAYNLVHPSQCFQLQ
jgi:hypothetical protein